MFLYYIQIYIYHIINLLILKKANVKKILVMYRDPRDVAVSNYYHVLKSNPWNKSDKFYFEDGIFTNGTNEGFIPTVLTDLDYLKIPFKDDKKI